MVWTLLLNYALTLSKVYSMSTDYVDQKTVFKNILSHYKITRNINDYGHRFVKKKGGGHFRDVGIWEKVFLCFTEKTRIQTI